jgi:hypothetical protein
MFLRRDSDGRVYYTNPTSIGLRVTRVPKELVEPVQALIKEGEPVELPGAIFDDRVANALLAATVDVV